MTEIIRSVVSTAKVQKIWEQFTTGITSAYLYTELFRLQKYKKFESNSQHAYIGSRNFVGCFDCKSTKNLRAIHNIFGTLWRSPWVVSTAKVQKIWEQFTTGFKYVFLGRTLFRLQKYKKFESNSQHVKQSHVRLRCCFDCKSTKNLRAIHNGTQVIPNSEIVVSTAKVQKIWEQFTTDMLCNSKRDVLFRLQKYKKFESNSQPLIGAGANALCCFDCKSTKNLRAIHNYFRRQVLLQAVVSTAKVQKIWEQFTTNPYGRNDQRRLFRLQKYKKFESNSQPNTSARAPPRCCFDCKSTKNLRAIHNPYGAIVYVKWVVSTAKVQKIWEQFTTRSSARAQTRWVVSTAKVQKIWEQFTTYPTWM